MDEIKLCPCGLRPTKINYYGDIPSKWMYAVPNCCGEWNIEFRAAYTKGNELLQLALDEWNKAPRAIMARDAK